MPVLIKWTFEKCQLETLKYKSRSEFQKNSPSAYYRSLKKKWLDNICTHMISSTKSKNYWSIENCKLEALKYKTRSDFNIKSNGAYNACCKNNWLDDVCKHMVILGSKYKRKIYSFEFLDNHVYIGLTLNTEKRKIEHLNGTVKSAVFNHIKETNHVPIYKFLTNDYVPIEEAKELEKFYINQYRNNGWIILNKKKGGGLGGNNIKWTYDLCQIEALKYNFRNEFKLNSKLNSKLDLDL
jgi:predicted GIY-YIG superfamily endonuclease